jgi:hypothetical protein
MRFVKSNTKSCCIFYSFLKFIRISKIIKENKKWETGAQCWSALQPTALWLSPTQPGFQPMAQRRGARIRRAHSAVTAPGALAVARSARALRWPRCGGISGYSISEEGALRQA